MLAALDAAASGMGLLALRERIAAAAVPRSARHRTLATWNIRELGRRPRRAASLVYIAEIIRSFDIVSIVELREDLTELRIILELLGPTWSAIYTVPVFDQGGNRERSAFVFDTRRVQHTGLASGAEPPRAKKGDEYVADVDWWREPYIASFRVGALELLLVTAHIRWGRSVASRLIEIELFVEWVALQMKKDPFMRGRELIACGDFNIPTLKSRLYAALTSNGLTMPAALAGVHGSNLARNKRYDQILHGPGGAARFTGRGGALDFYSGPGGMRALYPSSVDKREFTYELSDHLPLWAELHIRDEPEPVE